MNVTAKNELLKIARQAVELAEQGYETELVQSGFLIKNNSFLAPKFEGFVCMGEVIIGLNYCYRENFQDRHTISMPLFMGEANLPGVVIEFQEKIDNLIARLPEIDERRKQLRRMALEEELQSL